MTESSNEQPTINPAWKSLLDKIPDAMHPLVIPELQQWDKQVADQLTGVRSQYDPYKKFVDNKLDPQLLEQGLYLLNQFQNNPQAVIDEAIKAYELPYVDSSNLPDPNVDSDYEDDTDISNNPLIAQLTQQLEQLQSTVNSQQTKEQEEKAANEFNEWLDKQTEEHGEFNRMFVTALMTQGVDFESALKQYQEMASGTVETPITETTTTEIPVVLGSNGQAGSGMPDSAVNFSSMKDGELNDAVIAILQQQQQQNNQG